MALKNLHRPSGMGDSSSRAAVGETIISDGGDPRKRGEQAPEPEECREDVGRLRASALFSSRGGALRNVWQDFCRAALVLVTVASCGVPHMALPKEFKRDMAQLTTDGRKGGAGSEFELGPYKVESIERRLSNTEGFDVFENFEPATRGGYRFSLSRGGKGKLSGKCAPPEPKKNVDLDGSVIVKEESSLACVCEQKGKEVARLFLEDLGGEYGGPLVVGEVQARATGIYKLDNGEKQPRPAGYRVDDDSGPVSALDVLSGEARVWLKNGLEEPGRSRLVCAMVGLMLWTPPARRQES